MSIGKKVILVLGAVMLTSVPLMADRNDAGGLLLEFGGNALIPQSMPTGLGGSVGVGYASRDFNVFFRPQVLIAEPGGSQKIILIPAGLFEVKIRLLPGFLTLLPYVNGGAIATKLKRSDGTLGGNTALAMYVEGGVGAELVLTHEISFVPRLGIASALLYDLPDSNNHSGVTISAAVRYTFGRSRALDY